MMTRLARWLTVLLVGVLAVAPLVRAQNGDEAAVLLEAAIQRELVDGDLNNAIELYEAIVARFGDDRPVAAEALLRLGWCHEQLGAPEARQVYERLLREYGDQARAAGSARVRLDRLAVEEPTVRDASEVVVREVWTRPAAGVSPNGPNPNFVIFSDLAVHNAQTQETRRLTSGARSAAYPVLSPDRQRVAYLSWSGNLEESLRQRRSGRAGPRSSVELRIVGVDGSDDRVVLSDRDVSWLRPLAWSPDGRQILAVFERPDGMNEIAVVSAADGSARVIKSLEWRSPQEMSFSPNGRYVAYNLPSARNSRQLDFFVLPVDSPRDTPPLERRYSVILGAEQAASLTEDQQVIHLLNRLSFGPRPGDIERVKAMGIDAYIEAQLYPERIPDPVVDEKLASYTSLTMSIEALLEDFGPVVPQGVRPRASIFEKRAMAERRAQGQPRVLDDNTVMPTSEKARRALLGNRPEDYEISSARLIRAIYSERQLLELMLDFWMNHFSINHGDHQFTAHFEEQVIRPNVFGKFEDLLMAVARHPRMLNYLDNWRSSAPADVIEQRVAAQKATAGRAEYLALLERMPFLEQAQGLNENYARELMELHTLGVDGGYTQQDVIEVAKVLTGWTISGQGLVNGREDDGVFVFDPLLHVDGDKVVLGQTIGSGGVEEGEQLLKLLAHHPATARFISTKLARRFVADDPPAAVVEAASRTFQETGGDIRQVLRTIFNSAQFHSAEAYRAKIKKPLELVVSSLRALNVEFAGFSAPILGGGNNNPGLLPRMGERLYNYEAPDGNPDVGAAWMNSNALLVRLEFANALATGRLRGLNANARIEAKVDLQSAQSFLRQLGMPRPTAEQVEQTRAMLQAAADQRGASTGMQSSTMAQRGGPGGRGAEIDPAAIVVAAMLGSPQFQKR